jgi:hypothetical protein
MTLIRASRIATTATIEELMKAVRSLKSSGVADLPEIRIQSERLAAPAGASSAPAIVREPASDPVAPPPVQEAPVQSAAYSKPVSSERREEILNDDKLNSILASAPGALISDIRGR